MSFVAAATAVGTTVGLSGTAAIIGGGALIGAGVGGTYSALTGDGNILDSMLTGAFLGGLGGFAASPAGFGSAAATTGSGVTGATSGTTAGQIAANANTPAVAAYANPVSTADILAKQNISSGSFGLDPSAGSYGFGNMGSSNTGFGINTGLNSATTASKGLSPKEMLGYGLGATTVMGLLGGEPKGVDVPTDKGTIRPFEYKTARREPEGDRPYYFEPIEYDKFGKTTKPIDTSERNYFTQNYTALPTYKAAMGGEVPNFNNMPAGGLASIEGMRDGYGPMTTNDGAIPQFAEGGIADRPVGKGKMSLIDEYISAAQGGGMASLIAKAKDGDYTAILALNKIKGTPNQNYAAGGHLGGYSDGGQLLRGPGDGVSDSIPASINKKQPARLADGEFVIPARIVSELGNGSTEAGAKRLYEMMDRIQSGRSKTVGKDKIAVDSKARKHLPA
jgi:hypothetical protein